MTDKQQRDRRRIKRAEIRAYNVVQARVKAMGMRLQELEKRVKNLEDAWDAEHGGG